MTEAQRFVRRNRVDERFAAGIAAVGGLLAVLAGAEPTGSTGVDALLVFLSVGAVVWASASAPWWATAASSGVAAVVAFDPVLAAIGATGFICGLAIGVRQRDQSEVRAVVGAISMNVLIRSELDGFLGLSAIFGIGVGVALFVLGVRRRPSAIRRIAWIGAAATGAVAALALAGLAITGLAARPDLTEGASIARQAISTLNAGDYETAAAEFAEASAAFARADDRLGGVLALPSTFVPAVAQNVRAGTDLAAEAAAGTAVAAAALERIDPSTLTVVDGAIDLDAVAAVEAPLLEVQEALVNLRAVTDSIDSPWLIGRLQDELVDLDARLDENEPALVDAIDAVRIAPQVLGADEPRRYLLLLTTPSESRGATGFAGSFAEFTAVDGRLELSSLQGTGDLSRAASANDATCADCPAEYLARYGRFSLGTPPDYAVGAVAWSNFTIGGHFPDVARTAQVLYPQSGGAPIDGVIALDPYTLQTLMNYTGDIAVPEWDTVVTPANAATFLLNEQYAFEEEFGNQDQALQTLGNELFDRLLRGALPPPADLARDLGPLVDEHRLLFWTDDPDEQELFDRIGLTGALPTPGDDGGFSVFVANGGNSKIDYFLRRQVDVTIEAQADGTRRLVADVTLTNTAPTSGQPDVVLRNSQGLPLGSSYARLTFYGPGKPVVVRKGTGDILDEFEHLPEAGWTASSAYDVIGPGESVQYRVEYELGPDLEAIDSPVVWTQALAER